MYLQKEGFKVFVFVDFGGLGFRAQKLSLVPHLRTIREVFSDLSDHVILTDLVRSYKSPEAFLIVPQYMGFLFKMIHFLFLETRKGNFHIDLANLFDNEFSPETLTKSARGKNWETRKWRKTSLIPSKNLSAYHDRVVNELTELAYLWVHFGCLGSEREREMPSLEYSPRNVTFWINNLISKWHPKWHRKPNITCDAWKWHEAGFMQLQILFLYGTEKMSGLPFSWCNKKALINIQKNITKYVFFDVKTSFL